MHILLSFGKHNVANSADRKPYNKLTIIAGPSYLCTACNCMHHVHCATDGTLLLAMSTQPVDRAAGGFTILSDMHVMCEDIDWFDNSREMGAV